jgi:membrane carboxypeptidase/penicillin-binding protein
MLAGLPKSALGNPIANPKRARIRQQYIIERMRKTALSPTFEPRPPRQKS